MSESALSQLNFIKNNRLPIIRQNEVSECGLTCLAMILSYHGYKTDISTMRRKFSTTNRGVTLKSLMDISKKLGLATRALKVELSHIKQVRLPAVVHWDMNHFVVLKSVSKNKLVVHDPALGEREYTEAEFSEHFTGIVLELEKTSKFEKKNDKTQLKFSDLWSNITGLKTSIIQVLILSVILQLFIIASPFYLQLSVDEVLTNFDLDLLFVLALGFGGFTIINAVADLLRGYVILYAGTSLTYQIVINLFNHLIHLPLPFFEKRHIGDIVSRFSSTQPIKDFLTEGLVSALIDGVMAIVTLILMFIYSPTLAFVALSFMAAYFLLRYFSYAPLRKYSEDAIVASAKEQTNFLETIRGVMSIKLFARENSRQQQWQNLYADTINSNVKVAKLNIWFGTANALIFGLEHVVLVYIAIEFAMDAELSVGMIFAFMAYKRQFTDKAAMLIERLIEFKMLRLHLDRLSDITSAEREPIEEAASTPHLIEDGRIEIKSLSYAYDNDSEQILNGISFEVNSGETVAIVGTSGCGKTTLLKLMLGLFEANSGEILIDGKSIKQIGYSRYREQISAVMQDDELFGGSLGENIAFFDTEIDIERVVKCAIQACIHDDIMAMPMSYETFIGDMGSALSGGQKQRILLARALYQKPRILFMDEGTAHLDVETERLVNRSISKLGITRVIVAHRPETIKMADRVLSMENKILKEIDKNKI